MSHPDAVFGGVTLETVAEQVRHSKPSALTHDQRDDLITIMEYLREQTVIAYDQVATRAKMLADREEALAQSERMLEQRKRLVEAAIKATTPKRSWLSYLRG